MGVAGADKERCECPEGGGCDFGWSREEERTEIDVAGDNTSGELVAGFNGMDSIAAAASDDKRDDQGADALELTAAIASSANRAASAASARTGGSRGGRAFGRKEKCIVLPSCLRRCCIALTSNKATI